MSEKVPVTTKMEPSASLLLLFTRRKNGSANSWIDMKKQGATFQQDLLLLPLPAPRLYDKTLYTYSYVAVYGSVCFPQQTPNEDCEADFQNIGTSVWCKSSAASAL